MSALLSQLEGRERRAECLRNDEAMSFMFTVGESYRTQEGYAVQVVGRYSTLRGYETVLGDDGRHRYDRSDSHSDAGRCTGTAHDYSCPYNFARPSTAGRAFFAECEADARKIVRQS